MRTVILVLIVAVVALIIAIQTGFLDIRQTRGAQAPEVTADANGVSASGGQAPAFDVQTGRVAIGSKEKNVTVAVPSLEVRPPAEGNGTAAGNASN
jgi:hypothetical protein